MKKRIIAILLSLSLLCGTLSLSRPSHASGLGIGIGIFNLAWEFIGIMTGRYDDAADAIRNDMSHFEDYFSSHDSAIFGPTESQFQKDWRAAWEAICDTLNLWDNAGELIKIDNLDKDAIRAYISQKQYRELCNQVISITSSAAVDFTCGYRYEFLSVDLHYSIPFSKLPRLPEYFEFGGEAYSAVYFNDDTVVFPGWYLFFSVVPGDSKVFFFDLPYSDFSTKYLFGFNAGASSDGYDSCLEYFFDIFHPSFSFPDFSNLGFSSAVKDGSAVIEHCFVYNDGVLSFEPVSSVDVSEMHSGLITTTGDYPAFLRSITGVSTSVKAPDIDDLDTVIPADSTLSIPLNPDLDKPIADQVIVGDVAGVEDLPLSDYLNSNVFDIDISVPSVIVTKFPFCIPFDFVRFLGVLAADPIPPVFHIPISTSPPDLQQWADNETVGQFVAPDDPMFEINEEIVLDFANIPLVQPICYTVFIVGFVFLLIHITTKMIQH